MTGNHCHCLHLHMRAHTHPRKHARTHTNTHRAAKIMSLFEALFICMYMNAGTSQLKINLLVA